MPSEVKGVGDIAAQLAELASRRRGASGVAGARNESRPDRSDTNRPSDDAVAFTGTAETLRRAEQSLQSQPVVDARRVERVRAAIAEGSYRIEPERVAERLTETETRIGERIG